LASAYFHRCEIPRRRFGRLDDRGAQRQFGLAALFGERDDIPNLEQRAAVSIERRKEKRQARM
jgi:hypothetical protein